MSQTSDQAKGGTNGVGPGQASRIAAGHGPTAGPTMDDPSGRSGSRIEVTVPMFGVLDERSLAQPPGPGGQRREEQIRRREAPVRGVTLSTPRYDSRTQPAPHSTARRIGKIYRGPAESRNENKASDRLDDGYISSHQYADECRRARDEGNGKLRGHRTAAVLPASRRRIRSQYVDLDYHHPLEDVLRLKAVRRLLGYISRSRPGRRTMIEEILETYADASAPFLTRLKYWPFHLFIDRMRGSVSRETFRKRVAEHRATVRGFVTTARSVAEFGLTLPQRFSAPLFAVWNFTNKCNLRCRHCYQDAGGRGLPDELTREERLRLVDEMGEAYVSMVSFAGGEPLMDADLWPVLERCRRWGIHTSIATNGSLITKEAAARLAATGVKYVEVSLDSVHPERHDAFRGHPGAWERTVRGMRNVVEQEGLRLGIAMCVSQRNIDEVEDMLRFAVEIGANCFAHFNFIPVGRGLEMAHDDLTPDQRERLLRTLNEWMNERRISILSTAPQFGRTALAYAGSAALQPCSHVGGGGGTKARVVAKYLGGCGAGRCYVCIEPNGTITPCVYLPHRVMGNIRRRPFLEIFRNNEFWDLLCDRDRRTGHCEVCEFKHYCGGCRARADAYYGELNAADPGCLFNARHWESLRKPHD